MNWPILILAALLVFGALVTAADRFGRAETYTISTRELPNIAAELDMPAEVQVVALPSPAVSRGQAAGAVA